MDLYGNQKRYERIKNELIEKYSGEVKEIFKQYVALHDSKFEREQMTYCSALRSMETADSLCSGEGFFDEKPYSVGAVKEWWKHQLNRKSKQTGDKVKVSTLHKLQGQASKFLKFLEFIDSEEDMIFFNTHKLPPAKASRYFIVEVPKKKKKILLLTIN